MARRLILIVPIIVLVLVACTTGTVTREQMLENARRMVLDYYEVPPGFVLDREDYGYRGEADEPNTFSHWGLGRTDWELTYKVRYNESSTLPYGPNRYVWLWVYYYSSERDARIGLAEVVDNFSAQNERWERQFGEPYATRISFPKIGTSSFTEVTNQYSLHKQTITFQEGPVVAKISFTEESVTVSRVTFVSQKEMEQMARQFHERIVETLR